MDRSSGLLQLPGIITTTEIDVVLTNCDALIILCGRSIVLCWAEGGSIHTLLYDVIPFYIFILICRQGQFYGLYYGRVLQRIVEYIYSGSVKFACKFRVCDPVIITGYLMYTVQYWMLPKRVQYVHGNSWCLHFTPY